MQGLVEVHADGVLYGQALDDRRGPSVGCRAAAEAHCRAIYFASYFTFTSRFFRPQGDLKVM